MSIPISRPEYEAQLNETTSMNPTAEASTESIFDSLSALQNAVDGIAALVWGGGTSLKNNILALLQDVTEYTGSGGAGEI